MSSWAGLLLFLVFLTNPQKSWPQDFSYLNGVPNSYLLLKLYGSDLLFTLWLILDLWFEARPLALRKARRRGLPGRLIFLFLLSLIPAVAISAVRPLALVIFFRLSLVILVAFRLSRRSFFETTPFRVATLITLTLVSAWALVQWIYQRDLFPFWPVGEAHFLTLDPSRPQAIWAGAWHLRVWAGFPHPNVLGAFLAVFLLWLLSWVRTASSRRGKYGLWLVFFLGLLSLFLTFSQAAWFAFLSGLALTLALKKKRSALFWLSLFLGLLILGGKMARLPLETVTDRRSLLTEASLATIAHHPLTGTGLATSVFLAPTNWAEPVHNLFLLIFGEAGFFPVLFLILILLVLFERNRPGRGRDVFLVALGQIVFLSFFDHYFWSFPQGALLFWLVLSLAAKD